MELAKENKIVKVIIYTRVSTKEQVEGYSLSSQKILCKEYAEKQGWEVIEIFQEQGESAKSADRTQLQKLLDYCLRNKGKIDVVLVHKLDRMSRVTADYQAIRALLVRYGMVLRSVSEPIDGSPTGKFMENIFSAVAQLDNDVRAERTKEGLKERVRQGLWAWAPPIGYRSSPAGMVVDQEKAPLIRKAFELFSTGNYKIKDITRFFNRQGLRTKKGNKISEQTTTRILENKLYTGIITVKGWEGEVNGLHEKLISPEVFYRVQNIRRGKSFTVLPRLTNNPYFPLKNIMKCTGCDKFLTASTSKGRTNKYSYYHCKCGKTRIAKDALEETFFNFLKQIQPNGSFITLFKEILVDVWKMKQRGVTVELQKIDRELASLKTIKTRLIDKTLQGVISDDDYKEQVESISSKIATKEIERSDIRIEETNTDHFVALSEELFTKVSTIWLDSPFEQKLKFQHLLFPRGIVYDNGVCRTSELGLPFKLIDNAGAEKTSLVGPRGVEPLTFTMSM